LYRRSEQKPAAWFQRQRDLSNEVPLHPGGQQKHQAHRDNGVEGSVKEARVLDRFAGEMSMRESAAKCRDQTWRGIYAIDHEPIIHQCHRDRHAMTATEVEDRRAWRERSGPCSDCRDTNARLFTSSHELGGDSFVAIRAIIHG
jgi:hypothetical protein